MKNYIFCERHSNISNNAPTSMMMKQLHYVEKEKISYREENEMYKIN